MVKRRFWPFPAHRISKLYHAPETPWRGPGATLQRPPGGVRGLASLSPRTFEEVERIEWVHSCKAPTHHCGLYSRVGRPAPATRRRCHWFKSSVCSQTTRGSGKILFRFSGLPDAQRSQMQEWKWVNRAVVSSADSLWNMLEDNLKLKELIALCAFKYNIWKKCYLTFIYPGNASLRFKISFTRESWPRQRQQYITHSFRQYNIK